MKHALLLMAILVVCGTAGHAKASCETEMDRIGTLLVKKNYCEENADCINQIACPFGCEILINKKEAKTVQRLFNEYDQQCGKCKFRCKMPTGIVICREHVCVRAE